MEKLASGRDSPCLPAPSHLPSVQYRPWPRVFRAVQLVQWLPFRRADPACPSRPFRPWSRWRWRGPRVRRAVRPVSTLGKQKITIMFLCV